MKNRDSHAPVASSRPVISLALILLAVASVGAQEPPRPDQVFKTAVAAWQMAGPEDAAGRNEMRIVGAARIP